MAHLPRTPKRQLVRRATILAFTVCLAAAGCAPPAPTGSSSSLAAPTPSLPGDIAAAIDVREQYGLRSDVDYVRQVATNPHATADVLGIPLLPAEVADLRARAADRSRLWSTVEAYGKQHPAEWAGMYLDEAGGGDIITWFTQHVPGHEAALRRLTGPFARLRVEQATRTLADLQARVEQIEGEGAWFAAAGAPLSFAEVSEPENMVLAYVSSSDPNAPAAILAHFGGAGWLRVVSDGIGEWTGGTGTLRVIVVDETGAPVAPREDEEWHCRIRPDVPSAWTGGPGVVGRDGVCAFSGPVGATGYEITIVRIDGTAEQVLGHGRGVVARDRTTDVTITMGNK